MKSFTIILLFISIPIACKSWEYCKGNIEKEICATLKHFVCNPQESIEEPTHKAKKFLAHVPITRKLKKAFLNWHNYYRNRTAGGHARNKKKVRFPKATRMRELIWDPELSFLSHFRTKLVSSGWVDCSGTQRFQYAGQNIAVQAIDEPKPVLEIVYLSLRDMFNGKNTIKYPYDMPALFTTDHLDGREFTIMVNDRVSRVGCAVSLGMDCTDQYGEMHEYCYYTACTYDYGLGGRIYKKGKPARRCSVWGVGRSATYVNLCANSGKIFDYNV